MNTYNGNNCKKRQNQFITENIIRFVYLRTEKCQREKTLVNITGGTDDMSTSS